MRMTFRVVLLTVTLVIAACSGAAQSSVTIIPPTLPPATDTPPPAATPEAQAAADAQPADTAAEVARPDWHRYELVNARTGEPFTLADFAGRTVWVEPMATWCTNCRAQMRQVINADNVLGDEYVFIGISVAENVTNERLAEYVDAQGFNWIFAVTPPNLLQALTDTFGRGVVTPPSTPHFILSPDGSTSTLSTGSHSADDIVQIMQQASGAA